jgi:hypothetical protein
MHCRRKSQASAVLHAQLYLMRQTPNNQQQQQAVADMPQFVVPAMFFLELLQQVVLVLGLHPFLRLPYQAGKTQGPL